MPTFWNFGSVLGLCLMVQLLTGLFLVMHYTVLINLVFPSIVHICRDVSYEWLQRILHVNGAFLFFICLYIDIGRGINLSSYMNFHARMVGVVTLFMFMVTAFLGYVLPWGQMSFWGATVITDLFPAIPLIGKYLVQWIWGSFSVGNASLTLLFSFNFILPFIAATFIVIHKFFHHQTGAKNPLGISSQTDKVPFHSYLTLKDIVGLIVMLTSLVFLTLLAL